MNITENIANSAFDQKGYFLTPDLTQRLDLISHLLANTSLIPFIKSSEGCGKTRLARHLADSLSERYTVGLISGGSMAGIMELRSALADMTGLSSGGEISDDLLEQQFCNLAERKQNFLLLLDDADQLSADSLTWIIEFFNQQKLACHVKCVILSAVDALALPLGPVLLSKLKDEIQILDIPKFTLEQLPGFIDFVLGDNTKPMNDSQLAGLMKETQGTPGKLLWQVQFTSLPQVDENIEQAKSEPWLKPLLAIAIIAFLSTVGVIIYFQDEINQFIAGSEDEDETAEADLQTLVIPSQQSPATVIAEQPKELITTEPSLVDEAEAPVLEILPQKQLESLTVPLEQNLLAESSVETALAGLQEAHTQSLAPEINDEKVIADIQLSTETKDQLLSHKDDLNRSKGPLPQRVNNNQASPKPAPVTDISSEIKPEPEVIVKPKPKPKPKPRLNSEVLLPGFKSVDWLISKGDKAYSLQLLAVSDQKGIPRFIKQHKLKGDLVMLKTIRKNKPWYALLYGAFSSREAAIKAKSRLPKTYKSSSAWPKSVISIKQSIAAN